MAKKPNIAEVARKSAEERSSSLPERGEREKSKRTETLAIRLTPEEMRRVQDYFAEQGLPVSTAVRAMILREVKGLR
jgi:hypothetical protein